MEETYSHEYIEVLLQRLKELRELHRQEKRIERRAMAEHRKQERLARLPELRARREQRMRQRLAETLDSSPPRRSCPSP